MESDEELMGAVARGDERALGALVDRHAVPVHAYLTRLAGDPDEADDLLQDTWVRVARAARRFDPTRRFRPWLYGIATNLARDRARRRRVRERPVPPDPPPPPAERRAVERLDLRARLAELPEAQRAVLLLRYYHDLGEAEMAEALDVPRGTVKSRLHGALRALRRSYAEEEP